MKVKIKKLPNGVTSIKLDNKEINQNVISYNINQNSCENPILNLKIIFDELEIDLDSPEINITEVIVT